MGADAIHIHRMRVATKVGVPPAERGSAQEVEICLSLFPDAPLSALGDDIEKTIDYYVVTQRVLRLAAAGERRLIETLADEIATMLLGEFPLRAVRVEVRKFILRETEYVAVVIDREAKS